MSRLKIAFDISQTGRRKAWCGFYAAALIDGLLAADNENALTLMTSLETSFTIQPRL